MYESYLKVINIKKLDATTNSIYIYIFRRAIFILQGSLNSKNVNVFIKRRFLFAYLFRIDLKNENSGFVFHKKKCGEELIKHK